MLKFLIAFVILTLLVICAMPYVNTAEAATINCYSGGFNIYHAKTKDNNVDYTYFIDANNNIVQILLTVIEDNGTQVYSDGECVIRYDGDKDAVKTRKKEHRK